MTDGPEAAGLAVKAEDTGRVLMLQRSYSENGPAAGTWEFPGGKLEPGESPLAGATREWSEETGNILPEGGVTGSWDSPAGNYRGFVYVIGSEDDVEIHRDGSGREVSNPDDPDGDDIESLAWFEPDHLAQLGSALRPEAHTTPWGKLGAATVSKATGVLDMAFVPLVKSDGDNVTSLFSEPTDEDSMHFTLGVAYPANMEDAHGEWMSPKELELTAWHWMAVHREINVQHTPGTVGHGTVVESYIYRGPDWTVDLPNGETFTVRQGDWLVGTIWDDVAWPLVTEGLITGWSIEGQSDRRPGEVPDRELAVAKAIERNVRPQALEPVAKNIYDGSEPLVAFTQEDLVTLMAKMAERPIVNVAIPEQPAPIVNVNVPAQAAPVVNVGKGKVTKRVERDGRGLIVGITEDSE